MHIVIDARIINSTTGRYIERLLHYLEKIDTSNTYTILVPKKDLSYYTPTNKNFSTRAADFANYSFAEQFGLKKLLEELSPDLVHFCMPQQPIFYKGNHVTTFHDLTLLKVYNSDKNWVVWHAKQFVGRFVFKQVLKKSRFVITDANYTKTELAKLTQFDTSKLRTIYLAAEPQDKDAPSLKYTLPFKKYLLYVGQQSDFKNIRRLGDAHHRLLKKYPDLGLVLVGRKNDSALQNEAYFESKKYTNIHFTGFVDDSQLNWLYKHAETYVFASLMEGFGLPGLEAMTHNTPVVSSDTTVLPEVYGDAAHYFNPESVTDMARAIDEVLSDKNLRQMLTQNGAKQLRKYSWQKTAEQTHAVYMEALKK